MDRNSNTDRDIWCVRCDYREPMLGRTLCDTCDIMVNVIPEFAHENATTLPSSPKTNANKFMQQLENAWTYDRKGVEAGNYKVHFRNKQSSVPHNQLARQPVEGRIRDGGLRVGEMEQDAIISHGIALKPDVPFEVYLLDGLPSFASLHPSSALLNTFESEK